MTHNPPAFAPRGEGLLHFRKWLRHGRSVAALTPSSRALAAASSSRVRGDQPQTIVELGAGTGAVTRAAAARMHPESRLIAIECDPDFAALLEATVPRAEAVCASAVAVQEILAARGIDRVDVVLNGLPTPSLAAEERDSIFAALRGLPGRPWVSQLTVMPLVYWRFYKRFFEEVQFEAVWRNLPPAGVYHCRGWRAPN